MIISNSKSLFLADIYSIDDTSKPNFALLPVTGSIFSTFFIKRSFPKALIISDPTILGNRIDFSLASTIVTFSITAPKLSSLSQKFS